MHESVSSGELYLSRGSQEEGRGVTLDDDSTLIEGDDRSDRQAFEEGEDGEDDEVERERLGLPHERKERGEGADHGNPEEPRVGSRPLDDGRLRHDDRQSRREEQLAGQDRVHSTNEGHPDLWRRGADARSVLWIGWQDKLGQRPGRSRGKRAEEPETHLEVVLLVLGRDARQARDSVPLDT